MPKKDREPNEEEELDKLVKRFSELLDRNPRVRQRTPTRQQSSGESEGDEKDRFIKHGK